MVDLYCNLGGIGVPISLSSLGRKYVKNVAFLSTINSRNEGKTLIMGIKIPNYLLGDVSTTITPKDLNTVQDIGFVLHYYMANYKGVACSHEVCFSSYDVALPLPMYMGREKQLCLPPPLKRRRQYKGLGRAGSALACVHKSAFSITRASACVHKRLVVITA
jgi:hypothetical protein